VRLHFNFSIIYRHVKLHKSRGSSVSIVNDYRLEDFSFSLCVQTGSGAHPDSCPMGTGGKARPGRDADHSPPSSAEVKHE
jgi:hypothetical protein